MKRVSLVTVFRDGLLLLGKRNDNGSWTLPGGGADEGESPLDCAVRELYEETGIDTDDLQLVDERTVGDLAISTFECFVDEDVPPPSGDSDPDKECSFYAWFDVSDGVPKGVKLAGPQDPDDNVVADLFGLQKAEAALSKMALIYHDADKPMTVYRVQNAKGEGPYGRTAPTAVIVAGRNHYIAAQKRGEENPQPNPPVDFPPDDMKAFREASDYDENYEPTNPYRFGFEKPEHAQDWFGSHAMEVMKQHGYTLQQVPAQKVYRSNSGKQLFFLPHGLTKSEKALRKSEEVVSLSPTAQYAIDALRKARGPLSPEEIARLRAEAAARKEAAAKRDAEWEFDATEEDTQDPIYQALRDKEVPIDSLLGKVKDKHIGQLYNDVRAGRTSAGGRLNWLLHRAKIGDRIVRKMIDDGGVSPNLATRQSERLYALAGNPHLSETAVRTLSETDDANTLKALFSREDIPQDVIDSAALNSDHPARFDAISHEKLSRPTIEKLLADPNIAHTTAIRRTDLTDEDIARHYNAQVKHTADKLREVYVPEHNILGRSTGTIALMSRDMARDMARKDVIGPKTIGAVLDNPHTIAMLSSAQPVDYSSHNQTHRELKVQELADWFRRASPEGLDELLSPEGQERHPIAKTLLNDKDLAMILRPAQNVQPRHVDMLREAAKGGTFKLPNVLDHLASSMYRTLSPETLRQVYHTAKGFNAGGNQDDSDAINRVLYNIHVNSDAPADVRDDYIQNHKLRSVHHIEDTSSPTMTEMRRQLALRGAGVDDLIDGPLTESQTKAVVRKISEAHRFDIDTAPDPVAARHADEMYSQAYTKLMDKPWANSSTLDTILKEYPPNAEKRHLLQMVGDEKASPHFLRQMLDIEGLNEVTKKRIQSKLAEHDIDAQFKHSVESAVGTHAARKLRDQMVEQKLQSIQTPKGEVTLQGLNDQIASAPRTKWNVETHRKWSGSQRHSDETQHVFTINYTKDKMDQLREAGVYDTFKKLFDASHHGGHPVGPHTVGWIRYTGNPCDGIYIDEIQSDFAQKFSKVIDAQGKEHAEKEAKERGLSGPEAERYISARRKEINERGAQEFPDDHHFKINKILFGDAPAQEHILEAFRQHLRDTGKHNAKIQMPGVKTKMMNNGQDISRPPPKHMVLTYEKIPQDSDMEPKVYGSMKSQVTDRFKGHPTYEDKVRKTESIFDIMRHKHLGIEAELEHTSDRSIATEIAMDHLTEDPEYYQKLKTIEKSINDIKGFYGQGNHNYNHVLDPKRHAGYSIALHHSPGKMIARVLRGGKVIGYVNGEVSGKTIRPHAFLKENHRGKGLGLAAYEALYAHAMRNGVTTVAGDPHTEDAHRVHLALAAKHGLKYRPAWTPDDEDVEERESARDAGDYRYLLKNLKQLPQTEDLAAPSLDISKSEDEISRLLEHPDATERSMALKLAGVRHNHLMTALEDEDEAVRRAALVHPEVNGDVLHHLMRGGDQKLQLEALSHPDIHAGHLHALYEAYKDAPTVLRAPVAMAIGAHSELDQPLMREMVATGDGYRVVDNVNIEPELLVEIVANHLLNRADQYLTKLARRALVNPVLPLDVARKAFDEGDLATQVAIAEGPNMPADRVQEVLQRGQFPGFLHEAPLREAILNNPNISDDLKGFGSKDRVAELAAKADTVSKAASDWLLGQPLNKSVDPRDYGAVRRALTKFGSQIVDHAQEYGTEPDVVKPDAVVYKQHVLTHPETRRKSKSLLADDQGITKKLGYDVEPGHPTHGGVGFMVKPYHESIIRSLQKWQKHPHQGWSEMTNQALYHAAGIGRLHQLVHVAPHNMGPGHEEEPALIVRIDPEWRGGGWDKTPYKDPTQATRMDARKLAIMDMLSNNLDRHYGNLLYTQTGGEPTPEGGMTPVSSKILAIDHGRSFQYTNNHRYKWDPREKQPNQLDDLFVHYVTQSPLKIGLPEYENPAIMRLPGYERQLLTLRAYAPAFDWWDGVSHKVREAFDKRLGLIKDPKVRAHLKRNFNARANWLDERAKFGLENYGTEWYKDPIEMYRPDQMTEDEIEEKWRNARNR